MSQPPPTAPNRYWPSWPPPEIPSIVSRARRGRLHRRPLGPGMALYILSPVVAELCLGSTPAFNYIFFGWMLSLMYGGGAILIHETAVRWGKGWPTILALGIAYAIAEEGIAVRTFFDRTAPVLKPLGDYGWAGGANWVWITHLSLYHAVISISIPIFLVTLAYPARRSERWVSDRWLGKAAAGFIGIELFWLVIYQHPVDGRLIVASLAAIAGLIVLARVLPATIGARPLRGRAPSPRRVAIVAFAATVGVFAMDWTKGLGLPAAGAVAAMLAISAAAGVWFVRGSRRAGWTDRQRYAVAAGISFFLPVLSPLMELSGIRFQLVVGIITGWLIVRQWRRIRAREAAAAADSDDAVRPVTPQSSAA